MISPTARRNGERRGASPLAPSFRTQSIVAAFLAAVLFLWAALIYIYYPASPSPTAAVVRPGYAATRGSGMPPLSPSSAVNASRAAEQALSLVEAELLNISKGQHNRHHVDHEAIRATLTGVWGRLRHSAAGRALGGGDAGVQQGGQGRASAAGGTPLPASSGGAHLRGQSGGGGGGGSCWHTDALQPCRFPFRLAEGGDWFDSCATPEQLRAARFAGPEDKLRGTFCATSINLSTGKALGIGSCAPVTQCRQADTTIAARPGSPVERVTKDGRDVCDCGGGALLELTDPRIECGTVCDVGLQRMEHLRFAWRPIPPAGSLQDTEQKWSRRHREEALEGDLVRLCESLFNSIISQAPSDTADLGAAKRYTPPGWEGVRHHFRGAGVVFSTGAARLPSAIASALFMRLRLGSTLPVEIWFEEHEQEPGREMVAVCQSLNIFLRRIPESYGVSQFHWERRWKHIVVKPKSGDRVEESVMPEGAKFMALKPLAMLLSSFDTVVFMDDDAIPVSDPLYLIDSLRKRGISALFFRDLWSLFHDAEIWKVVDYPGGKPTSDKPHPPAPSQDSGAVVICKSCNGGEGFAALSRAVYLNAHHMTFYPAIYQGGMWHVPGGHIAFGTGDKDTFQIGWMLQGAAFDLMGPVNLVGGRRGRCGATLGQPGPDGKVVVIHMNSIKLHYRDWKEGKWDLKNRFKKHGFLLSKVHRLKSQLSANSADGQTRKVIVWGGVAGSGAARCIRFFHPFTETDFHAEMGYNVDEEVRKIFTEAFQQPWVEQYMSRVLR